MAKPRPEKKAKPTTRGTLPMQLQPGDRFSDEEGEWEVIARPWTTRGGKLVHPLSSSPATRARSARRAGVPMSAWRSGERDVSSRRASAHSDEFKYSAGANSQHRGVVAPCRLDGRLSNAKGAPHRPRQPHRVPGHIWSLGELRFRDGGHRLPERRELLQMALLRPHLAADRPATRAAQENEDSATAVR